MAEIKFSWFIMQTLGYSTYLCSLLLSITGHWSFGTVKDLIIWLAGLVFITIKAKVAWLKYQKEKYEHEERMRNDAYEWKKKNSCLDNDLKDKMK